MKVHEIIKKYIEEKGIKQNYICEKTGIAENTLSIILNGKRKLSADEFELIIKALEIDPNEILG